METSLLRKSISFILMAAALNLPLIVSAQTSTIITIGDTTNMFLLTGGNTCFPCMYFSSSYTQQLVQNNEPQAQFQFSLLPNPAKGVTMVRIVGLPSKLSGVLHVTVADLTGRDVLARDLECDGNCRMDLDIEGLPAGAYFVRITSKQGSAIRKLIVK